MVCSTSSLGQPTSISAPWMGPETQSWPWAASSPTTVWATRTPWATTPRGRLASTHLSPSVLCSCKGHSCHWCQGGTACMQSCICSLALEVWMVHFCLPALRGWWCQGLSARPLLFAFWNPLSGAQTTILPVLCVCLEGHPVKHLAAC